VRSEEITMVTTEVTARETTGSHPTFVAILGLH
jgi:hypothetical protein